MQRRGWSFLKFLVADFIRSGLKWGFWKLINLTLAANKSFEKFLSQARPSPEEQRNLRRFPARRRDGAGGRGQRPGFWCSSSRC